MFLTPLSDCRATVNQAKVMGLNIIKMKMTDRHLKQLIKSSEFITAFNKAYPDGADMTIIRVNKVMRKNNLPKIIIAKR